MRVFIIALAVIYWGVASLAHTLMASPAPCKPTAEFSAVWSADDTSSRHLFATAGANAPTRPLVSAARLTDESGSEGACAQ